MTPSPTNPSLSFWDVPAALLGMAIPAALCSMTPIGEYKVVWLGAPLAMVMLRRTLLPGLTPAVTENLVPISPRDRLVAYALMITGGVIALLTGLLFYSTATDPAKREFCWVFLPFLWVGGAMATLGVRKMTHPSGGRANR
jgi:hypothetical protein